MSMHSSKQSEDLSKLVVKLHVNGDAVLALSVADLLVPKSERTTLSKEEEEKKKKKLEGCVGRGAICGRPRRNGNFSDVTDSASTTKHHQHQQQHQQQQQKKKQINSNEKPPPRVNIMMDRTTDNNDPHHDEEEIQSNNVDTKSLQEDNINININDDSLFSGSFVRLCNFAILASDIYYFYTNSADTFGDGTPTMTTPSSQDLLTSTMPLRRDFNNNTTANALVSNHFSVHLLYFDDDADKIQFYSDAEFADILRWAAAAATAPAKTSSTATQHPPSLNIYAAVTWNATERLGNTQFQKLFQSFRMKSSSLKNNTQKVAKATTMFLDNVFTVFDSVVEAWRYHQHDDDDDLTHQQSQRPMTITPDDAALDDDLTIDIFGAFQSAHSLFQRSSAYFVDSIEQSMTSSTESDPEQSLHPQTNQHTQTSSSSPSSSSSSSKPINAPSLTPPLEPNPVRMPPPPPPPKLQEDATTTSKKQKEINKLIPANVQSKNNLPTPQQLEHKEEPTWDVLETPNVIVMDDVNSTAKPSSKINEDQDGWCVL